MIEILRRRGLLAVALIALMAVAALFAACGDSDDASTDTTTTTEAVDGGGATATTEAVISSSGSTIVVDGKTQEEYETSLADLEAAVTAAPDDLDKLQELAIAQFQTGRLSDAATTYQKMLDIKDDAFTRNNLANVLREMGETEKAKILYRQAIDADPTLVHPYVNLAHLLINEGDGQGALELLRSGLEKVTGDDKISIQSFIDRLTQPTTTT